MDSKNLAKSPFKKIANKNESHCGFLSMKLLQQNKPYKITELRDTMHKDYGNGLLAFVTGNRGSWRSQFPPKFYRSLDPDDINALRQEIAGGRPPYLIFRAVMEDNSFKIDLAPHSDEMVKAHKNWTDVGDLQFSPDNSVDIEENDTDAGKDTNVLVSEPVLLETQVEPTSDSKRKAERNDGPTVKSVKTEK